jgi:hypothetical protein
MREFSILVFPHAKLRRCSSFSCGVGTFFLASSRSSCRRSVINSPLAQGFYGHGSEEEQGCGIPPFERRERWGTRPHVQRPCPPDAPTFPEQTRQPEDGRTVHTTSFGRSSFKFTDCWKILICRAAFYRSNARDV